MASKAKQHFIAGGISILLVAIIALVSVLVIDPPPSAAEAVDMDATQIMDVQFDDYVRDSDWEHVVDSFVVYLDGSVKVHTEWMYNRELIAGLNELEGGSGYAPSFAAWKRGRAAHAEELAEMVKVCADEHLNREITSISVTALYSPPGDDAEGIGMVEIYREDISD